MIDTTQTQRDAHVQAILQRCEHLGVVALSLQGDGSVRSTRGMGQRLAQVPALTALCRGFAKTSGMHSQSELSTIAPGVLAASLCLRDEAGVYATAVLLFATQRACQADGCIAGWLGGDEVAACLPMQCWDEPSAHAAAKAMLRWSEDLSDLAHAAVDTQTFTQQLTHAFDTIELMYQLGRSMKQPSLPEHFLRSMCERVRTTLSFGWMMTSFANAAYVPKSLRARSFSHGTLPDEPAILDMHVRDLLASGACAAGPCLSLGELDCGQVAVQPLDHKGQLVGVLIVGGKHGDDPDVSSYDTQLLEATAGFLGSFIDNVGLYDDQDDLFVGTVQAMTAAIDAKDSYTCGHSERVALLSWMIAKAAGLTPEACNDARIGGLVHDVGKIGVPEHVLCKPGKLSDEEFDHIKRHPEIGHRILRGVKLLTSVLPGVLYHHERWDGNGYPSKLKGEDIPMLARVIAVADTFDAMSSDRSYRKKLDRAHVLAEIARSGGSQLDPALAPLILQVDLAEYDALAAKHAKDHVPVQAKAVETKLAA